MIYMFVCYYHIEASLPLWRSGKTFDPYEKIRKIQFTRFGHYLNKKGLTLCSAEQQSHYLMPTACKFSVFWMVIAGNQGILDTAWVKLLGYIRSVLAQISLNYNPPICHFFNHCYAGMMISTGSNTLWAGTLMHVLQYIYRGGLAIQGPPIYINVRPAFFYTRAFDYNSVAICLIMIKLSHYTVEGPSIYYEKFQGRMRRTFWDADR